MVNPKVSEDDGTAVLVYLKDLDCCGLVCVSRLCDRQLWVMTSVHFQNVSGNLEISANENCTSVRHSVFILAMPIP